MSPQMASGAGCCSSRMAIWKPACNFQNKPHAVSRSLRGAVKYFCISSCFTHASTHRRFKRNSHHDRSTACAATTDTSIGSGGSGNGSSGTGSGNQGGSSGAGGSSSFHLAPWQWVLVLSSGYVVLLFAASAVMDLYYSIVLPKLDTKSSTVSIIMPALNESKCIRSTIDALKGLDPAVLEVIVVDGGSTDGTVAEARSAGAKVVQGAGRGRGRQMNAGAEVAKGDILCFLHADTYVSHSLVDSLRAAFADPRTVLVGLSPSIELDGKKLEFESAHNFVKTFYGPGLFRPASFLRGLRLLFGDQAISCRAADLSAVGGYEAGLPIMEDADLCLRLHAAGPSHEAPAGQAYHGRGRVRMLLNQTAVTSGRRLGAWGPLYGTYVLARIAVRWYWGASHEELHRLYKQMYTDAFR